MAPTTSLWTATCNMISSIFNWAIGRSELKNTAAMQQSAQAAQAQACRDKTAQAIAERDTDEIRKKLAQ